MSSSETERFVASVRPSLTKIYVNYFRRSNSSNLTGPQLTIMGRLAEDGPARISDIAKLEGIRMPTASNALRQLEDRGMVTRVRETSDRRGVRVELTDAGREEFDRVGEERNHFFAQLLEPLSDDEVRRLDDVAPIIIKLAHTLGVSADEDED